MNRRGFLGSILAACVAPAIVRADSLMRIVPAETMVLRVGDRIWISGLNGEHAQLITAIMSGIYAPGQTIKIRMPNTYTRLRA